MNDEKKVILIQNMVDNLPTIRKKLDMSQSALAETIGISRSTLAAVENKKKNMTWNMFLSLILVFTKNKNTDKLLNVMEIYTDDLNEFIKQR